MARQLVNVRLYKEPYTSPREQITLLNSFIEGSFWLNHRLGITHKWTPKSVIPQPLCTFCRYFETSYTPDSWMGPAEYDAWCDVGASAFDKQSDFVTRCGKFKPKAGFKEKIKKMYLRFIQELDKVEDA